jgi:hypothetical protein
VDPAGAYAYLREDGPDRVLVALNASDRPATLTFGGERFQLDPWSGEARSAIGEP